MPGPITRFGRDAAGHLVVTPGGDPPSCPRCAGGHELCATCPVCHLGGIPVTGGLLAAHAWYPRDKARYIDGPDDAEGFPTPGEWVGGCENRTPADQPE